MKLDVAFLPHMLSAPESTACLVIDALRASSSAVVLFERAAKEIVLAPSPAMAHRMANQASEQYLLCGETGGLPPPGFDYGNSPSEFATLDMRGRGIILSTTNGTKALQKAAASPLVLMGTLLNASAATRALLAEAEARGLSATLVCAGLERGTRLSLEDTFVAGALVDIALVEATDLEIDLDLMDSSLAALRLYKSYGKSAIACFRQSEHGRSLIDLGFGHDLQFCAQVDRFDAVPRLKRASSGQLMLVAEKV